MTQLQEQLEKLFIAQMNIEYLLRYQWGRSDREHSYDLSRQIADLESQLSKEDVDEAFESARKLLNDVPAVQGHFMGLSDEEALVAWRHYLGGWHRHEPSAESCRICQPINTIPSAETDDIPF